MATRGSYYRVWRHIVACNYTQAVVSEDDMVFRSDYLDMLTQVMHAYPNTSDDSTTATATTSPAPLVLLSSDLLNVGPIRIPWPLAHHTHEHDADADGYTASRQPPLDWALTERVTDPSTHGVNPAVGTLRASHQATCANYLITQQGARDLVQYYDTNHGGNGLVPDMTLYDFLERRASELL